MRFKALLVAGAALLLYGCSSVTAPEPTKLEQRSARASLEVCDYDDSRTGYFVRSGAHWTETSCTP